MIWFLASSLLFLGLVVPVAGQALELVQTAEGPVQAARLDEGLQRALVHRLPPDGIAIGVALLHEDLPAPGPARRALVQARQQRVLDILPPGTSA